MLKRLRLRHKMILFLCIILLSTYTILDVIVLKTSYTYSHEQAKTVALLTSKDNAEKVVLNFEKIETIGISVANQMEAMVEEHSPSRKVVISTMKNTLNSHKDIFGIAVVYEPNEFDGKDINYIDKEGDNSKGQFMPYVTRKRENKFSTELSFNPLYNEKQNKWYTVPKSTHKIYLTEPTYYPVQGKNVTMVSVVVPIMRNDKFVGVVSIDTTIDYLQTEIDNVRPMNGFSQIISSEGTYVANGANSLKVLDNISKEKEWIPILEKTSKGEEFTEVGFSSDTREKVLRVFSSIHIQGTDQYWTYVSIIPLSHIFAEFNFAFKLMIIVGFILFSFIIYVNYSIIIKDL
jgi:methyl-accepting chemotaxis protein